MENIDKFNEALDLCNGAQNNKNVQGWVTLNEFDNFSSNKDFDAKVYKSGNKIVIAFAGSNIFKLNDLANDYNIMLRSKSIPSQYGEAEKLYNKVKQKYPNIHIEFTGYSLGGTIANLLSHRTGLPSVAIAPIGSKHIAEAYPYYFKYKGENIITLGRKGDTLFNNNLDRQSGNIYIIPDLNKNEMGLYPASAANHLLHKYNKSQIRKAKPYKKEPLPEIRGYNDVTNSRIVNPASLQRTQLTGFAAPLPQDFSHIFTREEIGQMNSDDFSRNESAIMEQLQSGLIGRQIKNFANFINPITGDGRIFSREDLGQMSGDEYSANESAIMAQLKSIGIPTGGELEASSIFGGGTVYVRPYTKSDGTEVRGYWRSLPAY